MFLLSKNENYLPKNSHSFTNFNNLKYVYSIFQNRENMMSNNRITEILNIKYPIVQAPMSWLTSAELVASVSNAGGLGVLGANAGQSTITTSVEETTERMRQEIRKVKQLTDKPFGLNILFAQDMSFSAPLIDLALEEKVPVLAGVMVDNTDFSAMIKDLKSKGLKIILRPTVPTIENCQQAEKNGADILVVTGFDSGGLALFRKSVLFPLCQ